MSEMSEMMYNIRSAIRRRRVLLIVTPVLFLAAAVVALQFIEPKYRSNTTILVQNEQSLSPVALYNMGDIRPSNRNRLESLNEIVYSRSTIEMLIDSLKLDLEISNELERQRLVDRIQKNIRTYSRASDSFEITYTDQDPYQARDGAELLANHFIQTKLRLETRRHDETVRFFENRLADLGSLVGQQRDQAIQSASVRLRDLPSSSEALQTRLQSIDASLGSLDWQRIHAEESLRLIDQFLGEPEISNAVQYLYRLQLAEIPNGAELSTALQEYDSMRQEFTENYPRLVTQGARLRQLAERIRPGVQLSLDRLQTSRADLVLQKERVVEDMQRFYVANQQATTQQSSVSIYEDLYNEMRVRLEQARMSRDIGQQVADQFMILDAANLPQEPYSPNRIMILVVGLFLGIITGSGAAILAEIMDMTLRKEDDIPVQKPIIAYLTNG